MKIWSGLGLRLALFGIWVFGIGFTSASAKILYSGPQAIHFGGLGSRNASFDINGDKINDFGAYSYADVFGGNVARDAEIYPINEGGVVSSGPFGYTSQLGIGQLIDASLRYYRAPSGNLREPSANPEAMNSGAHIRYYIGVTLVLNRASYYGWIDMDSEYLGSQIADLYTVRGWAFEDRPGVAIKAGDTGAVEARLSIHLEPNKLVIQWPTGPGMKYQLERSSGLKTWENVPGGTVTGDGSPMTLDLPVDTVNAQFYRVTVLP